jgi:nucleoside-diphosphate-sugar epimerase
MARTVLVTGATGALGPHVVSELLRDGRIDQVAVLMRPGRHWDERCRHLSASLTHLLKLDGYEGALADLTFVSGDLGTGPGLDAGATALSGDVAVIVHAGASTRFAAPIDELRAVNVHGTRRLLYFARGCRRLEQFLFVSTVYVAGTRTGAIAEDAGDEPESFVNAYERTKHEAERLVAGAGLPARIARLSTCLGHSSGYVHRFGALHQCLRWLMRGLVPVVPGSGDSRVDLIPTDVAGRWIARAATTPVHATEIHHVAAGAAAAPLTELIQTAVDEIRWRHTRWIEPPLITDAETYALFERTVAHSRDPLFARVLHVANSFFPTLVYPKVYETRHAEELWGGPLPVSNWQTALRNVIGYGCSREWRGSRGVKGAYA